MKGAVAVNEKMSTNNGQHYEYGSIEGEQYFLPISGDDSNEEGSEAYPGYALPVSTANSTSTVASSCESDTLVGQHSWPVQIVTPQEHPSIYFHSSFSENLFDLLFEYLGFRYNPFRNADAGNGKTSRNTSAADLRLSMLSNFSTAYNILNISLSLKIMHPIYNHSFSSENESFCSSALIAGMIVGQLAGGALGDMLGRHRAMALVMLLQVTAALCSAVSYEFTFQQRQFSIYQVLAVCRFVLGLGAGGVYPLAATLTAESSQSKHDRTKAVALTFSFQGVGYLVVPVVTWIVVSIFGQESDISWRIILGLGAVPGIILTFRRLESTRRHNFTKLRRKESKTVSQASEAHAVSYSGKVEEEQNFSSAASFSSSVTFAVRRLVPVSIFDAVLSEKDLFLKLMGTGGCWLLFDVLFYGNTLFQHVVLSAAFGSAETVAKAAQDTALISLLALPGYFVSVFCVGRQSPWYIQLQGFFVIGILYLAIGVLFDLLAGHKAILLLTYGSTFFFSNYGPNATTFMMPSMTFSVHCRSTLNGVCAALGKSGAFIGTAVFVVATDHFGQEAVFLACAVLSFIGCIVTLACIDPNTGVLERDDDEYNHEDRAVDECDDNSMAPLNVSEEDLREMVITSQVPLKVVVSQPSLFDYYSHH